MRSKLFVATITLLTLLLIGPNKPNQAALAQSTIQELIITEVDTTEFPQINLQFRTLDGDNLPARNVQLSLFEISENNQVISPENLTQTEEGIWVHFIIDAGVWLTPANLENARTAITDFVQTTPWMKEDLDRVALTIASFEGEPVRIDFTGTGRELLPTLEAYSRPPIPTRTVEDDDGNTTTEPIAVLSNMIPVVRDVMDEMAVKTEAANQAKFVVLISSGLESGANAISTLAEQAVEQNIPIYTLGLRGDQAGPLRNLATQSNGRFVLYSSATGGDTLFSELVSFREQHLLTYRSQVNEPGNQTVELIANVSETGRIVRRTAYNIEVNPPRVLISSPQAGQTIDRESSDYIEDRAAISPTTTLVVANVVFPDGHLRRLNFARLLVDGREVERLTRPSPTSDLEFTWDIRQIQQDGITELQLEVEIQDELGFTVSSQPVQARVNVMVPPPPTPTPEPVIGPDGTTITVFPTATPIVCVSPDPVCDWVERPIRANPISFVSLGIALFSLLFAGVVYFNRDKPAMQSLRNTAVDFATRVFGKGSVAKAYLEILEGDVNINKRIEIYGETPIGRSRQFADVIFQQYNEKSPISRLHCTIIDQEDHFLIRDESSAHGTFLNGRKLIPLEEVPLTDGDEIELAHVERGGVRLLFHVIPDEEEEMPPTRNMRPPDFYEDIHNDGNIHNNDDDDPDDLPYQERNY